MLPTRTQIEEAVGVPLDSKPMVVSVHPVTLQDKAVLDAQALFAAIERIEGAVVVCCPNADAGCERILELALECCASREQALLHRNLDHLVYWGLLHHASVLIGNSSSGIMETPSVGLPCVNIGDRQYGRVRARNIIDVPADAEAIERMFTPEFRNRLDAIIPFAPLGTDVIRLVVDKFVMQLDAQLADRNVEIELTDAARDWLAERGYDRNYGARPLARVVQDHIKKPLADMLLFGDLAGGGLALVDAKDGKITVTGKPTPQRALPGKRTALPAPEEQ